MAAQLNKLTGVIEIAWFETEAVAYVKINPKEFEQEQISLFR